MPVCPDDEAEFYDPVVPELSVDICDPDVLGYLYGPDGEPMATILSRPVVPFGFQAS